MGHALAAIQPFNQSKSSFNRLVPLGLGLLKPLTTSIFVVAGSKMERALRCLNHGIGWKVRLSLNFPKSMKTVQDATPETEGVTYAFLGVH